MLGAFDRLVSIDTTEQRLSEEGSLYLHGKGLAAHGSVGTRVELGMSIDVSQAGQWSAVETGGERWLVSSLGGILRVERSSDNSVSAFSADGSLIATVVLTGDWSTLQSESMNGEYLSAEEVVVTALAAPVEALPAHCQLSEADCWNRAVSSCGGADKVAAYSYECSQDPPKFKCAFSCGGANPI